jgi:hypothetical protein
MDETGGNNFSLIGTSQLLSVPFAFERCKMVANGKIIRTEFTQ